MCEGTNKKAKETYDASKNIYLYFVSCIRAEHAGSIISSRHTAGILARNTAHYYIQNSSSHLCNHGRYTYYKYK